MNLLKSAAERIIITAHRGVSGGNIPCNTIAAYDIALSHGADMIEIDANISRDGTLYSFHPYMERHHLNRDCYLPHMSDEEIKQLRYVNYDRTPTQFAICTIEEIFERYKNRCFINVDKFWDYPKELSDLIRKFGMEDQIVVKSPPNEQTLEIIENYAPEISYLPIITSDNGIHEKLKQRNINYIGAEVVFSDETSEVGSKEYVEKLHGDGKLVWVNSIIYNHRDQLAAGHSDDTALTESPEKGWGWLVERGYDIIQTDWTLPLRLYLEKTGKLYK